MDNWLVHLQGIATLLAALAAAIMTFYNTVKQGEIKREVKHLVEVEERVERLLSSPNAGTSSDSHKYFPGAGGNL